MLTCMNLRFTSEEDQQRALAEMGGISCLGRPMRVSSASVKTRTASTTASAAASPMSIGLGLPSRGVSRSTTPDLIHPRAVSGLGIPFAGQQELPRPRSVTAPVAQLAVPNHATPIYALGNGLRMRTPSPGLPLLSSDFATSSLGTVPDLSSVLQMQQASASVMGQSLDPQLALTLLQIQALAALPIAPNPNGPPVHHQVSYNDPNNSTVFVGGLSSLINEETLQILFSPFGDIGYVSAVVGDSRGWLTETDSSGADRFVSLPTSHVVSFTTFTNQTRIEQSRGCRDSPWLVRRSGLVGGSRVVSRVQYVETKTLMGKV